MLARTALAVFVALAALPAHAVEPEALLPATCQFYVRWNGIRAYQTDYDGSARGKMFSGDTGRAVLTAKQYLLDRLHDSLSGSALSQGQTPDQLIQINADAKELAGLFPLLGDHGLILAAEVRDLTQLNYQSLFQKVGDALRSGSAAELVKPEVHLYAVVPGAAPKAGPILSILRLLAGPGGPVSVKTTVMAGRSVTLVTAKTNEWQVAAWCEGDHLVAYAGNGFSADLIRRMQAAGPNLTGHRLYKAAAARRDFTPITRGFFDGTAFFANLKRILALTDLATQAALEAYGLASIGAATFQFGFDGFVSRAWLEVDCPKAPFGFAGTMTRTPFKMTDLPPIPADAVRWLGCRMDFASVYDGFLSIAVAADIDRGSSASLREKREDAAREVDKTVGIDVKRDLVAALGDKLVTYSAPSENAFTAVSTGQVIAISVRDQDKLWAALDQLEKRLEAAFGAKVRLRTRQYHGVTIREHVFPTGNAVCPSYAVCDGWLVVSLYSQPVQGFILRTKGKLPVWKPDNRTAATLAKRPADAVGIEYSDPRVSLKQIITIIPIVAGLASENGKTLEGVFDTGSLPNAEEATAPLFPNVTWLRNDGRTFRFDAHDSFGLPLEFLGPDVLSPFLLGGFAFRLF